MLFDSRRADLIIQYALLLAGEEDEVFARQLGPIHLIKYVYLGDLAYARRFGGVPFTGAAWRFHNFGPWDAAVFERVEPAAHAIHAEQIRIESSFGDEDWVRYRLRDTQKLDEIERSVPAAITLNLRREVHKHLADTPSLLDYVYKTKPMLCAAPGEYLDLSVGEPSEPDLHARYRRAETPPARDVEVAALHVDSLLTEEKDDRLRMEQLSNKKRKRFQERVRELRGKQVNRPKLVNPVPAPRYDDVYERGVAWLEEIAGSPQLEPGEFAAEFSDDVWKSSARKGEDVP